MSVQRQIDICRMRIRSLLRRNRIEQELRKELQFHLDEQAAEVRAAGLSPVEARRHALKMFGGVAQIEEECREMRSTSRIESLVQDLRYASRLLARSPGFTAVVVLTLALSVGATSAIVSVLQSVLLRPLPFPQANRIVRVFTANDRFPKFAINPNDFRDLRDRLKSFESFAAYNHSDLQLAGTGEAVRLAGFSVTAGYFHVLGLRPAIGREFERDDELPGRGRIAIVSDKIWRTRLGSRHDVIGQKIVLNAVPYAVVGVMPAGVQHPGNMYHAMTYGEPVDVWVPFTFSDPRDRGSHYLDGIARLRPGISVEEAQDELNAGMRQLGREHEGDLGWSVRVVPLQAEIVGRSRPMLLTLLGAVVMVLLLACVNTSNLLLAQATARKREMALRAAIGASRMRLMRQVLTESLLLAVAGGVIGTGLAVAGVKAFVALLPADFPRAGDIHVGLPVLVFTLVIAAGTGIVFGLVPALQGARADLRTSLHESGRSATGSRSTLRLRSGLVISEVTLACALLIGAGLMLRSFLNLLEASPGFQPQQTLTASLSLPSATYSDSKAVAIFAERLVTGMQQTPGVTAAGVGSDLPWTGWDDNVGGFQIAGETSPPHDGFEARYHAAGPGFFRALGIPVIRGRGFNQHDTGDAPKAFIINQALAKFWRRGDALGGKITFSDHPKANDWVTVVGIVGDVKDAPKDAAAKPAFWWPLAQAWFPFRDFSIAVRSNQDTKAVVARMRSVVHDLDSNLAVADVRTMERITDESYSTSRFVFVLVGLFAALALLLAAIGTYGVIAYSVSQRLHEFGIRMALGARPLQLAGSVLFQGLQVTIAGTVFGIVLGIALSRLLGSMLYGVGSADPLAISGTALIVVFIAGLACFVPALRATRADPMSALRVD